MLSRSLSLLLSLHPAFAQFAPSPSSVVIATIARPDTGALDDAWVPVTLQELAYNGNAAWPTVSSLPLDATSCASGGPCFVRNRCPYDGYGAPRLSPDGTTLALGGEYTRAAAQLPEAVGAQRVIAEVSAKGAVAIYNFSGACEATGQVGKTCGTAATTTVFSAQSVGATGWALACREMWSGTRFVFRNLTTVTRMDDGDRNYAVVATSAFNPLKLSLILAAYSTSKGNGLFDLGNASSIGSRAPPYAAYLTGTDVSTTPPVCTNGGTTGAPSDVWVETTQRVWACVPFSGSGSCPTYGVQLFVQAYPGAPWGRVIDPTGRFLMNTPCSSLTGRLEGGVVVIYATTCLAAPRASCTPTLRRILYAQSMETTIATAPVGTMFHGVSLPPCAGAACPTLVYGVWKIPSPSPAGATSSPTASPTASPTSSRTAGFITPTATSTLAATASGTPTASATGSGTSSGTPSGKPTGTAGGAHGHRWRRFPLEYAFPLKHALTHRLARWLCEQRAPLPHSHGHAHGHARRLP